MKRVIAIGFTLGMGAVMSGTGCSSDEGGSGGNEGGASGSQESAGSSNGEAGSDGASSNAGAGGDRSGAASGAENDPTAGTSGGECEVGTRGCDCYGDGSCDEGLLCEGGECVACPEGTDGCACYGNGSCDDGFTCDDDLCVGEGGGNGGASGTGGSTASSTTGGSEGNAGAGTPGGQGSTDGDGGSGEGTSGVEDSGTGGSEDSGTAGAEDPGTGGTDPTGGTGTCQPGSEECECYGNDTCDAGLTCTSGTCVDSPFCMPETMIDDLEDGDGGICENQDRDGGWWTYNNSSSGTITPVPDTIVEGIPLGSFARDGSDYGIRLTGSGFGNADLDAALVGFSLVSDGSYNATVHRALTFWARANTELAVRVELSTVASNDVADGGSCVPKPDLSCFDHYGTYVNVGADWQQYWVNFSGGQLDQEGWGVPVALDLAHLMNVHFFYRGDGNDGTSSFDNPSSFQLYIDDVAFVD